MKIKKNSGKWGRIDNTNMKKLNREKQEWKKKRYRNGKESTKKRYQKLSK